MSTRGCVAVKTGEDKKKDSFGYDKVIKVHWKGIYNHSDSYPTWLGAEVYKQFAGKSADELKVMCAELLRHSDWDSYLSNDFCEYCGKQVGQPHSFNGAVYGVLTKYHPEPEYKCRDDVVAHYYQMRKEQNYSEEEINQEIDATWGVWNNLLTLGFPDPEAKYHQHSPFGEGNVDLITDADPDPLFMEWVYVVDPEKQIVQVYASKMKEGSDKTKYVKMKPGMQGYDPRFPNAVLHKEPKKIPPKGYNKKDGYWYTGHSSGGWKHVLLYDVDLNKPEPDWQLMKDVFDNVENSERNHES
jgi:hypothetical protein